MTNALSALTAIAVYSRLCELGHAGAAIVCGVIAGALARYAFGVIKKSAGAATPNGQKRKIYKNIPYTLYHKDSDVSRRSKC